MNKQMKWLSMFFSILLLINSLAISAYAGSPNPPELIDDFCGDNVVWEFSSSTGILSLTKYPDTKDGRTYDYDSSPTPWYEYNDQIVKVEIGEGIVYIGHKTFYGCTEMVELILPKSLQEIGSYAFANCGIEHVSMPDNLEIVGDYAFCGCCLKELTLPDNLTVIGNYAFSDCKIKELTLPANLKVLGDYTFNGCYMKDLIMPERITKIGNNTFSSCVFLEKIIFSESLRTIGTFAFSGCKSLTSVTIPDSVDRLGFGAFSHCSSLTRIKLSDSIKKIESGTFEQCTALESILLPKALTEIESSAFIGCKNLKKVVIPQSVDYLDGNIFDNCASLKYAVLLNPSCGICYESDYDMVAIPDSVDIYGYRGSTAETYCQQNGNTFYAIDDLAENGFLVLGNLKVDHDNKVITGVDSSNTSLEDIINVSEQYVMRTSANTVGTGTVITITDKTTGQIVDEYSVVMSGDLNGDGVIDVFDQAVVTAVANGETELKEKSAEFLAADLNADGVLDVFDVSIITSAANYEI